MNLYIINWPMFLSDGHNLIKKAKEENYKVFCDLKLYDISETMKLALIELRKLGVDYVSIIEKDVPKIISLNRKEIL